ncbi:MAG: class I SAM-dependent methyltransferase [Thermoanaerobaculia bacterium]
MEGYLNFSLCYDEVLGGRFFDFLEKKFKEVQKKYHIKNIEEILDLGCGTGLFLKNFYGKNIKIFGIDQAFTMLYEGKKIKNFNGICFKFPPIPVKGKFSLIVSFYDTLNHLLNSQQLKETFFEVKRLLKKEGFFLFDTNNLNAFKKIMGSPEPFIYESTGGFIQIHTQYFKDLMISKAEISGKWMGINIREEIYERYWSQKEIKNYLKEAGFNFIKKEEWVLGKIYGRKPIKDFWIAKI